MFYLNPKWWDEAHINYYNRPFLYKTINS
jgi:hypothetical protein